MATIVTGGTGYIGAEVVREALRDYLKKQQE